MRWDDVGLVDPHDSEKKEGSIMHMHAALLYTEMYASSLSLSLHLDNNDSISYY